MNKEITFKFTAGGAMFIKGVDGLIEISPDDYDKLRGVIDPQYKSGYILGGGMVVDGHDNEFTEEECNEMINYIKNNLVNYGKNIDN